MNKVISNFQVLEHVWEWIRYKLLALHLDFLRLIESFKVGARIDDASSQHQRYKLITEPQGACSALVGSLKYIFCNPQGLFSFLNYSTSRFSLNVLCRKESLDLFILWINPVKFFFTCLMNSKGDLISGIDSSFFLKQLLSISANQFL